jgi:hypothetical protein
MTFLDNYSGKTTAGFDVPESRGFQPAALNQLDALSPQNEMLDRYLKSALDMSEEERRLRLREHQRAFMDAGNHEAPSKGPLDHLRMSAEAAQLNAAMNPPPRVYHHPMNTMGASLDLDPTQMNYYQRQMYEPQNSDFSAAPPPPPPPAPGGTDGSKKEAAPKQREPWSLG